MIEIMDTTLRDGEQTSGVSFAAHEKLSIAQVLLSELGVNRVEIASARVSEGEFEAVRRIARWAERTHNLDKLEVLGFVDGTVSLDWIESAGCKVVNLLCKGSYKHVTEQLHKTPEQHIADITQVVSVAHQRGIQVNIYLEDWSNGIQHSPEYVFQLVDALKSLPIIRFMLPDTLGILNPGNTYTFCKQMVDRYPELRFDFHAHNDYDLAVANVYSAVRAGIQGIHTTVNGLGERAGNADLVSCLLAILKSAGFKNKYKIDEKIDLSKAWKLAKYTAYAFGVDIPINQPAVGDNAFAHESGIHADGALKDRRNYELYDYEELGRGEPEIIETGRMITTGEYGGIKGFRNVYDKLEIEFKDEHEARNILELARYANVHTQKPLTESELKFIYYYPEIAAKVMTVSPYYEPQGALKERVDANLLTLPKHII